MSKHYKKSKNNSKQDLSKDTPDSSMQWDFLSELQFVAKKPAANKLDYENLLKDTSNSSDPSVVIPDPTKEIMNASVNDIEFVGYNSFDMNLLIDMSQNTRQDESYEEWVSQHKAIIRSSRKENRTSKAPSLKGHKDSEPTKMIRLDINEYMKKIDPKSQDDETPKAVNKIKMTPEQTVPASVPKKFQDAETQDEKDDGKVKSIFEFKAASEDELKELEPEKTEALTIEKKAKTQILPNSPAPIPDSDGAKKKTFDEKINESKRKAKAKSNKDEEADAENFFGMPPQPSDN